MVAAQLLIDIFSLGSHYIMTLSIIHTRHCEPKVKQSSLFLDRHGYRLAMTVLFLWFATISTVGCFIICPQFVTREES
jgi:hypothetical protein